MDEFRGMCEWEVTVGDGVGRGLWGIMLSTYLHIMGNIFKTRVVLGLRYPLLYIYGIRVSFLDFFRSSMNL